MADVFIGEWSNSGELIQLTSYGDEGQDHCYDMALDLNSVILAGSVSQNIKVKVNEEKPKIGTNSSLNKMKIVNASDKNLLPINSSQISIFPNPSNGEFTVTAHFSEILEEVHLKIYGVDGKVVINKNYKDMLNIDEEIDLKSHSKGMYFIELIDNDESIYNEKIVIE